MAESRNLKISPHSGFNLRKKTVDPAVLDAAVPSLVLQPIVENAIRHGIEPHARPGRIELRAAREGDELVIIVTDNGAGMPPGGFTREGIGVANTRARLAELYGARHRFNFSNRAEGGLCVTIAIPFEPAPLSRRGTTNEHE